MEAPIGPPATLTCELGQARKGATAAGDVCAGMWLVGASTHLLFLLFTPYLCITYFCCSLATKKSVVMYRRNLRHSRVKNIFKFVSSKMNKVLTVESRLEFDTCFHLECSPDISFIEA